LWYGVQLCLTAATGIIIGVAATPRKIVRGIFIGMAIIIVLSVISGRTGVSAVGPVLVGVTGGKTVLGMAAATLAAAGLAVLFDRQQNWLLRLSSLPLIPVGAYYATHVEAATAKVAVLITPVAFLGFLVMRYLSPRHRWVMVLLAIAVLVPLTIFVASSDLTRNADQKILGALHKDKTLTGRTVMWAKADRWISEAPILGHGYRAF
jgi:exopolysaccharide production protein ExoQ